MQCCKCAHIYADANKLITFNKLPLLRHSAIPYLYAHQRDPDFSSWFQWIKQLPKSPKTVNVITLISFHFVWRFTELKYRKEKFTIIIIKVSNAFFFFFYKIVSLISHCAKCAPKYLLDVWPKTKESVTLS